MNPEVVQLPSGLFSILRSFAHSFPNDSQDIVLVFFWNDQGTTIGYCKK
jgi:hypothetical protein